MEYESDGNTNYIRCSWNGPPRLGKEAKRVGNRKMNRDHPSYSMTKIGQNTEKSPGNVRGLAITQTPLKDHHQTLV